jgi:hypothetical protein
MFSLQEAGVKRFDVDGCGDAVVLVEIVEIRLIQSPVRRN